MIAKQLDVGGFDNNFSYIVVEEKTGEGMVIDPCGDVDLIFRKIKEDKIKLKYIVNTHGHIDHIQGNKKISQATGAKVICHRLDASWVSPDIIVEDGDILRLGDLEVKVIHTPGHTGGSICLLVDNALFTGDTLFVGYCGRTDSAGASSEKLYHSLFDKIAKLPVEIKVYPGHNYGKRPVSTVGYERLHNPYYQCKNREEFVELRRKGV